MALGAYKKLLRRNTKIKVFNKKIGSKLGTTWISKEEKIWKKEIMNQSIEMKH